MAFRILSRAAMLVVTLVVGTLGFSLNDNDQPCQQHLSRPSQCRTSSSSFQKQQQWCPISALSRRTFMFGVSDNESEGGGGEAFSRAQRSISETQKKQIIQRRPKKLPFYTGLKYLYKATKGQTPQYQYQLQEHYQSDCYIIWDKYVTLTNAKAIYDVLETYNLEKPPDVTQAFQLLFFPTGGILAAPYDEWKQQRRMTAPALAEGLIGSMPPKLKQAAMPLYTILHHATKTSKVLEMDYIFSAMTMDTIGSITLGKTFDCLDQVLQNLLEEEKVGDNDDRRQKRAVSKQVYFSTALEVMSADVIRQMVSPRWVLKVWKPGRKVREAKEILDAFLNDCINERLELLEKEDGSEKRHPDLLNILLEAESNGKIARDDVKAQLLTFLFAGYDTTAHTLSYMLYEIAQNPQLQADIAKEAKQIMPNINDPFPLDPQIVANRLPLLDCAWMETLRKHPATSSGPQRLVSIDEGPIVVGDGIEIPGGVTVTIPPYALHRNTDYWPDPETFDCSRWATTKRNPTKSNNELSFLPFSAGPRACMGAKLARLEALSSMAALFRQFEVTCVETKEPIAYTTLTTKPRDGIRFTFRSRQN